MVRRKGEKPIVHQPLLWTENCVIAHMIRTGDHWLFAWMMQQCVQIETLSKRSGISTARLDDLWRGDEATEGELEGVAVPFRTDVASLRASIALAAELGWHASQRGQVPQS